MSRPANPWDVPFSRTSFLLKILNNHDNIENVRREKDILFTFRRKKQNQTLQLLGGDEYAFSLTLVYRALEDFGDINFICVGGAWNGYSIQAKDYCIQKHIGLYNTKELNGGLWKDEYWNYTQKDDDGNEIYYYKR
ncbi:MAG: hypothetical protein ACR65X_02230 [Methylocystis sp.]